MRQASDSFRIRCQRGESGLFSSIIRKFSLSLRKFFGFFLPLPQAGERNDCFFPFIDFYDHTQPCHPSFRCNAEITENHFNWFLGLISQYFRSGYHFPLRYFIYTGITAMVRLIIVDHESATSTILFAGAILLMVIALCLILYSDKVKNI